MDVASAYKHLMANYKFQTSNYALYIYDHMLTFGDEVEKIWSQPLTFATLLFYLNRYITHFQFIIFNVAYYENFWPIKFRVLKVAETIMILRVYALYHSNKYILVGLFSLVLGQIIVSAYGIHWGRRVPMPDGFPGCVLTGGNNWIAALWGAPMVTDTCIFTLTLWKTLRYRKHNNAGGRLTTMQIILRDGIMYYLVIFGANFMNLLLYLLAVEDLKAVGAGVSQILTAIMINRLQLNLRRAPTTGTRLADTGYKYDSKQRNTDTATGTFFTVGNLGEDMEGSFDGSTAREESDMDIELRQKGKKYDGVADFEVQNRHPYSL